MTIPVASRAHLRVLLIDADERVFDTFVALAQFSNPSWDIRHAPNHDAGFDMARKFAPHVISANIGPMPSSGLSFAQSVRQDTSLKNTFLIAIASSDSALTIGEIDKIGFDLRLAKPVGYVLFTRHLWAFDLARSLSG